MELKARREGNTRAGIVELVTSTISSLLSEQGDPPPEVLDEETCLIGTGAVLSSLGLVSLIVELEQILEEAFGTSVVLADERAMSQRRSPFRTVGALADYIWQLAKQA